MNVNSSMEIACRHSQSGLQVAAMPLAMHKSPSVFSGIQQIAIIHASSRGSSGDFRSKRMTKILLIRHGHVEGIKPERFRGREPLELTAQGRAEAVAAANRIADRWRPRTIYTSPMGRCVKTAEAVAKICAVAVQTCNDLNDLDYGAWQFKTFQQAKAEDPMLFAAWFATPTWSAFREANHCRTLPPEPPTLRG